MRSGFKSKIGNVFCFLSLLILVVFYGCRTSKNSVVKEKIEIEKSELNIEKFDSVFKIVKDNFLLKVDSASWSTFLNNYDILYNGTSNDDFFEVTKNGDSYVFKGKGIANIKQVQNKGDSTTIKNQTELTDEKADVRKNGTIQTKSEENQTKIDKDKQNKPTGFNWNFTIFLIVIGVVALILLWKFGLPKFKKR